MEHVSTVKEEEEDEIHIHYFSSSLFGFGYINEYHSLVRFISFFSRLVIVNQKKMPAQRGLAQECHEHFQTSNLYEIFSVDRAATDAQSSFKANRAEFFLH